MLCIYEYVDTYYMNLMVSFYQIQCLYIETFITKRAANKLNGVIGVLKSLGT